MEPAAYRGGGHLCIGYNQWKIILPIEDLLDSEFDMHWNEEDIVLEFSVSENSEESYANQQKV